MTNSSLFRTFAIGSEARIFFEDILILLLDSEFWILTPKQRFEKFF